MKEVCIFERPGYCSALKEKNCERCSFYKSVKEYILTKKNYAVPVKDLKLFLKKS